MQLQTKSEAPSEKNRPELKTSPPTSWWNCTRIPSSLHFLRAPSPLSKMLPIDTSSLSNCNGQYNWAEGFSRLRMNSNSSTGKGALDSKQARALCWEWEGLFGGIRNRQSKTRPVFHRCSLRLSRPLIQKRIKQIPLSIGEIKGLNYLYTVLCINTPICVSVCLFIYLFFIILLFLNISILSSLTSDSIHTMLIKLLDRNLIY